jgi:uncharacterized membrane protein YGL010W
MADIHSLFADYASYHRTPGNKAFHRLGIPLIMMSLIGLLTLVKVGPVDLAMVLIALSTLYYLTIEWRLAILMLGVSIGFYFLGAALGLWINVALQVIGWIAQFIGHSVYEKKQPAFFRNLVHLMVGPLWILNDLIPVVKPAPKHA